MIAIIVILLCIFGIIIQSRRFYYDIKNKPLSKLYYGDPSSNNYKKRNDEINNSSEIKSREGRVAIYIVSIIVFAFVIMAILLF